MLAADAPPAVTAAVAVQHGARKDPPAESTTALAPPAFQRSLTWMRQLALVLVYYLVFKAAATNPITANLREHLRAKLTPAQRGLTDTLRAVFRR